ncbi:hypothetical protein D3C75_1260650 [compost metagenome]
MRAAQGHQEAFGTGVTQHGNVGAQGLTERPLERVRVLGQPGAGGRRGREETFTLRTVVWLIWKLGLHVGLLLFWMKVPRPRPYRKYARG